MRVQKFVILDSCIMIWLVRMRVFSIEIHRFFPILEKDADGCSTHIFFTPAQGLVSKVNGRFSAKRIWFSTVLNWILFVSFGLIQSLPHTLR